VIRLPNFRRCQAVAAAILLAGALGGLVACDHRPQSPASLALSECRLPKLATSARCGTLSVPEDRSRPDGRRIDVFVAVLAANNLSPQPDPLVILAGGPGQAASQLAPLALRLNDVRRNRDIVLIDQRGTGRSSPLRCKAFEPRDDIESSFDMDSANRAKDCLRELEAAGVDPRQYTTEAWVADIDAVRAALGYPKVNLWGGSYGTRVALEYLRRHPERVRTMVLDGVTPPEVAVPRDVWPARERALDAIVADCSDSPSCRDHHPNAGANLRSLEEDLGTMGRRVEFQDPRTGRTHTMTMTFDRVLAALHALTYAPEGAALVPEIIDRARAGDFGPLLAAAQGSMGDINEQLSPALHYSVLCSEDAPRISAGDRERLARSRSRSLAASMLEVCALWPSGPPPADTTEVPSSDVPALLLSGGLDPVTPPSFADGVARKLAGSRHVVVSGYGHIVSPSVCVPKLITEFVESADVSRISPPCVDFLGKTRRPPLWADRMGPRP